MKRIKKVGVLSAVLVIIVGIFIVRLFLSPPNLLLRTPSKALFTRDQRASFDWREHGIFMVDSKSGYRAYVIENHDNGRGFYFIIRYIDELPNGLSGKQKAKFKHENLLIGKKAADVYTYELGKISRETYIHYITNYFDVHSLQKPIEKSVHDLGLQRGFMAAVAKPRLISIESCGQLLKDKRFLFLTGSGLSVAAGIPSGYEMKRRIGFDRTKEVDEFVQNVFRDTQKIIDSQESFERSFALAKPTFAHWAIKEIAISYGAHIVTSNLDLLHKETGVESWDMMHEFYDPFIPVVSKIYNVPWPRSGNFKYLRWNSQWLKDIDFVICVGMSTDIKGFLAWYKKHNPNGKIVAVNNSDVPYLGDEDYFLKGDAQEILPELAVELSRNEKDK